MRSSHPSWHRALGSGALGVLLILTLTVTGASAAAAPTPSGGATAPPSQPPTPSTRSSHVPVTTTAPAPGGTSSAPAGVGVKNKANLATLRADAAYWTAARMRAAVPVNEILRKQGVLPRALASTPPPPGIPQGKLFDGIPTVGTFFASNPPGGDTTCSGSVVKSPGRNLVLTAAHCAQHWRGSTNEIFVPMYSSANAAAAKDQTYGFFPVTNEFQDGRYYELPNTGPQTNLDFAFLSLMTNLDGKLVEESTKGGLTLKATSSTTPIYINTVKVIGYPSSKADPNNPQNKAVACDVTTKRLPGFRQMQMVCNNYYTGTSGGPWIANYNSSDGTGDVIGETGGADSGGPNNWTSYSPVFDHEIMDLYADAVAGHQSTKTTPYQQPSANVLPGGPGIWKHAKLMASGDYTGSGHSDLIVLWTDGEMTLYPSDHNGGFLPEHQLLAPNAVWQTVKSITGGDFDGSNRSDLMVLWNDGELSNYPDVGANGLPNYIDIAPSGSALWKNATQIAGGRFGGSNYVSDLVVRWVDGELSLYISTGSGSIGQEHQLRPPGSVWKYATLLTAGQYAGNQVWDLMANWVDGELDTYPSTNASGLGGETRIHDANSLWVNNKAMTTGDYTPDVLVNDVIVRWVDGETSMYIDTGTGQLGTETTLVSPPA